MSERAGVEGAHARVDNDGADGSKAHVRRTRAPADDERGKDLGLAVPTVLVCAIDSVERDVDLANRDAAHRRVQLHPRAPDALKHQCRLTRHIWPPLGTVEPRLSELVRLVLVVAKQSQSDRAHNAANAPIVAAHVGVRQQQPEHVEEVAASVTWWRAVAPKELEQL